MQSLIFVLVWFIFNAILFDLGSQTAFTEVTFGHVYISSYYYRISFIK